METDKTTIRFKEEDKKRIKKIMHLTGLKSEADAVRKSIEYYYSKLSFSPVKKREVVIVKHYHDEG